MSETGIQEVFAYLRLRGAAEAIEFYTKAFGAQELMRLAEPSGRIGHAEVRIGQTTIMLADEFPEYGIHGPQALGGTTVAIHLHVDDLDGLMQRAIEAGATVVRPPQDQFYGERTATVRDPFGHEWHMGQHIEDMAPEEMQRRYTAMLK
jgi:PhnB protein